MGGLGKFGLALEFKTNELNEFILLNSFGWLKKNEVICLNSVGRFGKVWTCFRVQKNEFNEFIVLLVSYLMLFLTDYTPDLDFQYNVGWMLVGLSSINILTNMIFMTVISLRVVYTRIKNMLIALKRKLKTMGFFKEKKTNTGLK